MRRTRVGRWGCGLALATGAMALPSAVAKAGLAPLSQSRSVDVSAEALSGPTDDQHSNSQQAPDFNPFSSSIATSAAAGDPQFGSQAMATASQQSSISGDAINASGAVEANSFVGAGDGALASAESAVQFHFSLDTPTTLTLSEDIQISLDLADPGSNVATLSVMGDGNTPVFGPLTVNDAYSTSIPLALAPGNYTFSFDAKSISGDETDNVINYSVAMSSVPGAVAPLPRAADAGFALLAGLGLLRAVQRIRSRRLSIVRGR